MDSYPLITLLEVKEFFGVREEQTKLDARYTLLAATATRQIERATGRWFTKQVHTEFFTSIDNSSTDYDFSADSSVGDYLPGTTSGTKTKVKPYKVYLSGVNIDPDQPFSLWYDPSPNGTDGYGSDCLLTPDTDYQIDYDNEAIILYTRTRYAMRALKVQYTAGYASDGDPPTLSADIPDDLKTAVLIQTQFLNVKLRSDNVGMATERTTTGKDRVISSPFMARAGLTPEAVDLVYYLKRLRNGSG